MFWLCLILVSLTLASCAGQEQSDFPGSSCAYAKYFDIQAQGDASSGISVVLISPDGAKRDTLCVDEPLDNIICLSSSHVAALAEVGADSVITAVSGIGYISNPSIRDRASGRNPDVAVYDIGYENSLDYERILALKPDVLVTYTVSDAEPPYVEKLRSLGVPLMILHDHLEEHPLARAEYVRLFGALTGRLEYADSLFSKVVSRYDELALSVKEAGRPEVNVLLNLPYADAWYIPGKDNYMSRIISDAGGNVLGAREQSSVSGVVSLETAYGLSMKADFWLNPGSCRTRGELARSHRLFPKFGPLAGAKPIYNNTLRITHEGGNDFWESGAMRPDLVLEDLVRIFRGDEADSLNYFFRLD